MEYVVSARHVIRTHQTLSGLGLVKITPIIYKKSTRYLTKLKLLLLLILIKYSHKNLNLPYVEWRDQSSLKYYLLCPGKH